MSANFKPQRTAAASRGFSCNSTAFLYLYTFTFRRFPLYVACSCTIFMLNNRQKYRTRAGYIEENAEK